MSGKFVISIDYELYWGLRDSQGIKSIKKLEKVNPQVIPLLLDLLRKYEVKVTFAVVGSILCDNLLHWKILTDRKLLSYDDVSFNLYKDEFIINGLLSTGILFSPNTIQQMFNEGHEIASHTFGHIYLNESGIKFSEIVDDFESFKDIFNLSDLEANSIVFPRNQINEEVISILPQMGFSVFRGTESSWIYRTGNYRKYNNWFRKLLRIIDSFINITGHHVYKPIVHQEKIIELKQSRFLRPYNKFFSLFDRLYFMRINKQMEKAVEEDKVFHLWFHPHNIAQVDIEKNLEKLERILKKYVILRNNLGMQNLRMKDFMNE